MNYVDSHLISDHVTVQKTPIKRKIDLFTATKDIGNWIGLCEYLQVSVAVMEELRFRQKPDNIKKQDCLTDYFNNHDPDWLTVAKVIANYPIGNMRVACQIAEDHIGINKNDCRYYLMTGTINSEEEKGNYINCYSCGKMESHAHFEHERTQDIDEQISLKVGGGAIVCFH